MSPRLHYYTTERPGVAGRTFAARPVKSSVLSARLLKIQNKAELLEAPDEPLPPRPLKRGDCARVPRPCPWVGCRYHLYLDAEQFSGRWRIRYNFPDIEPDEMPPPMSCLLDVIDAHPCGADIVTISQARNLTRSRVVQILDAALLRLANENELEQLEQEIET